MAMVRGHRRVRDTSTGYAVRKGVLVCCRGGQREMMASNGPEAGAVERHRMRRKGKKEGKEKENARNT